MATRESILKLKEMFDSGENISRFLRNKLEQSEGIAQNTPEIIEYAYDLQAGQYTEMVNKDERVYKMRDAWGKYYCDIIKQYFNHKVSILEAGVGEGNTLEAVARHMGDNGIYYGFDISWSRIAQAKTNLAQYTMNLFMGNLLAIPVVDHAVDVVFTCFAVETNGGSEEQALRELYRVTGKLLILIEPDYNKANDAMKQRMNEHGYVRDLLGTAKRLGYNVVRYEDFQAGKEFAPEYLKEKTFNYSSVIVIEKPQTKSISVTSIYADPTFKDPLMKLPKESFYFSNISGRAYPILGNIPCLRTEYGVLASKIGMENDRS